jgi:hypothetical protein
MARDFSLEKRISSWPGPCKSSPHPLTIALATGEVADLVPYSTL